MSRSRLASATERVPQHGGYTLEAATVVLVEGRRLARVEIEDRHQLAAGAEDRHDDLRARERVAGEVAREGVNVGDDLGRPGPGGGAADAAGERDLDAGDGSLERTHPQELRSDDAIEPRPARVGKGGVDRRRGVGQARDVVTCTIGERGYGSRQLRVDGVLVHRGILT